MTEAHELAVRCLKTLHDDGDLLKKLDDYARGIQKAPYIPDQADREYRSLVDRCFTNISELLCGVPVQGMFVDSFRRGTTSDGKTPAKPAGAVQPEWDHWQESRLDARQHAIYRGALKFGHSFVVTEKDAKGRIRSRGLSALKTTAIYEDPATDEDPVAALTVTKWNKPGDKPVPGEAILWTEDSRYEVTFKSQTDPNDITVDGGKRHGMSACPVTRFTAAVDLEGNTVGVIEPMIPLQDRLNQTVFDLLVAQTYTSFKVRTVTGMAPPMQTEPEREFPAGNGPKAVRDESGEIVVEDFGEVTGAKLKMDPNTGRPMPQPVNLSAKRMLFAEDKDTRFGTLDETPLEGFIAAIEMTFRHISALSQTPPHYLLGQIANLSAEALTAAENSLTRKVAEFQASFGESWERVFRLAAELAGDSFGMNDFSGEVMWRDVENRSLAQAGDALGKLAESLDIPKRGLWHRVPGATAIEMAEWDELREQDDVDGRMADAMQRNASTLRPNFRTAEADDGAALDDDPAA